MRNRAAWRPSRFVLRRGRLRGSVDRRALAPGSRLTADLQAAAYSRAIATHASGDLLDLGCGPAPLYESYRDRVRRIVCCDWPQSFHSIRHVDCFCDLARPLPLRSESFDTVLLTDVLEHVPDALLLVAEIARLLRPGGHLLLGVPFLYWLHEDPHDYGRYTEHQLRRFCHDAALRPLELEPYGGAFDAGMDLIAKHLAVVPLLASFHYRLARLVRPLARRLLARGDRKFPLGYLLVARRETRA